MTTEPLSISTRLPLADGRSIPMLGFGTWRCAPGLVEQAVCTAILAGYRHIDCAWTYGNEAEVGAGIAAALAQSAAASSPTSPAITRADLFITSKVWNNQQLPSDLVACCKESLGRLGLSYLDLYLVHWPIAFANLPGNKFAENDSRTDRFYADVSRHTVWTAMESLVDAGLTLSIGVSNHTAEQCADLLAHCRHRPVVNQVECHPFLNQRKLFSQLTAMDIRLTAYSPMGTVGREQHSADPEDFPLSSSVIRSIALRRGKTAGQVILRWHLQCGHVIIPRSSQRHRIIENAALYDFELTADDMAAIRRLGKRMQRYMNPTFLPGMTRVFPVEPPEQDDKDEEGLAAERHTELSA